MTIRINNCSPAELILPKNSIIGFFEPVNSDNVQELENDIFINAVNKVSWHKKKRSKKLTIVKILFNHSLDGTL